MIRTLAATALLSLAGCATHLVPMSDTRPVPQDRVFAAEHTAAAEGAQKVVIVRNAGALFAAGVDVNIFVDGERTAAISTSEALPLYLSPGEHLLEAKLGAGAIGQVAAAATVTIPSRFPIYRINMTDSDIKLQPSAE
jgi:hypothetical protein